MLLYKNRIKKITGSCAGVLYFMVWVSNDPPTAAAMSSLWQRIHGRKKKCLPVGRPCKAPVERVRHLSVLSLQIISSHAPVLWSLWGLLWLSEPCKSTGQPRPPVPTHICPRAGPLLGSCSAARLRSLHLNSHRMVKRLFLGTLFGLFWTC